MTAGELMPVFKYYLQHGYKESEIYAGTYSNGKLVNIPDASLKCVYVKEIRLFIQAVSAFTNSTALTIVTYSQGAAVTRKAILGGPCLDSIENLGNPLTPIIETFLSIAGVNHGSFLCDIPSLRIGPACNNVTGVGCNSQFIADMNSQRRYEGRNIITMRSTSDEIVNTACGLVTAEISGSNKSIVLPGLSHNQMMFDTIPIQYAIVTGGKDIELGMLFKPCVLEKPARRHYFYYSLMMFS
ncbi:lipase (class 2) domain-containing protein [Ditylenchus destructor]|uniref:Lipase (Class 2) domain-containing protein n=1 Tax=Ditylenchus destructor TaxID=166010 RepID=A0AAD4MNL5_9BILA|nr:lipase (class 2) domain-containing protein [Ditylenchus destructor]